jgi:hypothetical protein
MTESLGTEVVRHTPTTDELDSGRQIVIWHDNVADADRKTIARKCSAREFPRMSVSFEHLELGGPDVRPSLQGLFRLRYREPLDSDRATILQAGIANIHRSTATNVRKRARNPLSVDVTLAHLQQDVLARARGHKSEVLFHDEVVWLGPKCSGPEDSARAAGRP